MTACFFARCLTFFLQYLDRRKLDLQYNIANLEVRIMNTVSEGKIRQDFFDKILQDFT